VSERVPKRLNWGCGLTPAPGWINSDRRDATGIDVPCDIREGLPFDSDSIDYAVSIHALPAIPYPDLLPVLQELRRVLKPGGTLRLGLPDLDKGIAAYQRGNRAYFLVPDEDASSIGGKLVTQLIWYGHSRTLFTDEFALEWLAKAGFAPTTRCAYLQTASPYPEIVELDDRERESFFVEAVK
jgi:SAM-dependent methyltransferase